MDRVDKLIEESKFILKRNEWARKNNPSINIFEILRNLHDEVNLHSKFIKHLLYDIDGISTKFLELFLKELNIYDIDIDDVEVLREFKNIDLLLRTQNKAIIIENKIWANDQERQLQRYYEIVLDMGYSNNNIFLFYLSPFGRKPSEFSLGSLNENRVRIISYDNEISRWVDACIKESALYPSIRESLLQYIEVLKIITGKNDREAIMEVMNKIMQSKDNMVAAKLIKEAFESSRIEIQFKFWVELENYFKNYGMVISSYLKYNHEKVENFYLKSKNNKYYGLLIEVAPLSDAESVYLYIEIEHNVYWGFTVVDKHNNRNINLEPRFDYLEENFDQVFLDKGDFDYKSNIDIFERTQWFIGGFELSDGSLNFSDFSHENILKMVDDNYLKEYIQELGDIIKYTLDKFKETL